MMSFSAFADTDIDEDAEEEFPLVDPEMAPDPVRAAVMRGYNIILETKKYLPQYAGDRVSCTNCHFSGGNSLGEKGGGISLVGVTAKYPIHLSDNKLYTLRERINACFEKSINGKALPLNSPDMDDIVAYLTWISQGITDVAKAPWLGIKKLSSTHVPNPEAGEKKYAISCALCHGKDGQGQPRKLDLSYPPVWGEHSFNAAAGMNKLETLASFIYYNMPYEDVGLTEEEALDIAAYIIKQPRPT